MKIKRFALGTLWTNCYLVWDSKGNGVVFDPGGPAEEVEKFIKNNDIRLHWIVLTHGHGDHIGGIPDLRNLSEHGVAVHYADAKCLTDANVNLSGLMGAPVEFAAADKELSDGDVINIGSLVLNVIYTPGHTEGGICVLITDGSEKILISGDTLFARSIGRSDLPGGDEEKLLKSLQRLNDLPDDLKVFPGHGPETTIGEEKRFNPYWQR